MALTIVLTVLVTSQPLWAVGVILVGVVFVVFVRLKDWWRRAFVVTILAMFAGASHVEALAAYGSYAKIAAVGALGITTLFGTHRREKNYQNGMHKAVIHVLWITALLAVSSVVWGDLRAITAMQAAVFLVFVFVISRMSTVRWQDSKTLAADIGAAYWTSTSVLAAGAVLAFAGVENFVSTFSGRYQGILNNPNLLGMISAVTFAVGIGWAAHKKTIWAWASLLIPLSQVVLSESRTGLLATGAGVAWVILRGNITRKIVAGFVLAVGSLWVAVLELDIFGDSLDRFSAMEGGDLLNSRTIIWSDVLFHIDSKPLGIGWSATAESLATLNAAGIGSGLSSIHNSYLQMVFELGWFGVVPAILTMSVFLIVALRAKATGLGAGMVAATVTGSLIHFTESSMFGVGQPYPYIFWLAVLAAIVGTGSETKPDRRSVIEDAHRSLPKRVIAHEENSKKPG